MLFPLFGLSQIDINLFEYNSGLFMDSKSFEFNNKTYLLGLSLKCNNIDGYFIRDLVVYERIDTTNMLDSDVFKINSNLGVIFHKKNVRIDSENMDYVGFRGFLGNSRYVALPPIETKIHDNKIELGYYKLVNNKKYLDGKHFHAYQMSIVLEYDEKNDIFILISNKEVAEYDLELIYDGINYHKAERIWSKY